MVKINLLANAVAENAPSPAPKPVQVTGQIFLVGGALLALLIAVAADYQITNSAAADAENQLQQQQEAKRKLEDIKKQAEEFKKKKDLVENRLSVIKKLAAEQRGPVAMLSNINDRLPQGVNLETIKQRSDPSGQQIVIEGKTKSKELVTEFAQKLEQFSNKLFTNVDPSFSVIEKGVEAEEEYSISFKIVCNYNPPQPPAPPGSGDTKVASTTTK